MEKPQRAVILSDLHLGPDNDLTSFRDEHSLTKLLGRLAIESEAMPMELILAGDIFDFLQVKGYSGFDTAQSVEYFRKILSSKRTASVVGGLRYLAKSPRVEITVLSGNHDPELLIPSVREHLEVEIGRRGSIFYADDQPLQPGVGEKWPIWGRALEQNGKSVWVIHGDRWDPLNAIHRDRVREAIAAGEHVKLPIGSHLVFEILHQLKPSNPWIDQLAPEPAVMLLLIYLDPVSATEFFRKHLDLSPRIFRGMVQSTLNKGPLFNLSDSNEAQDEDKSKVIGRLLAEGLARVLKAQPKAHWDLLLAELESRLKGGTEPLPGIMAAHSGLSRLLLRAGLVGLRWSGQDVEYDRPDTIQTHAEKYTPPNVLAIVAGHTHGARARRGSYPAYFNTGTWLPTGRIPPGQMVTIIDSLELTAWPIESPRTYVEIDLRGGLKPTLFCCDQDGESKEIGDV